MSKELFSDIESFFSNLNKSLSGIKDGVVTIRVVGEFSAGKSRLISQVLANKIPDQFKPVSSQQPETRLELEIGFGEETKLTLIKKPDDTAVDSSTGYECLKSLDKFPAREEIAGLVTSQPMSSRSKKKKNRHKNSAIVNVAFEKPHLEIDPKQHRLRLLINEPKLILAKGDGVDGSDFSPKKLFLIDTPGWNSCDDDMAEQNTNEFFVGEKSLGLVYVCKATRVDSVKNKERLEDFLQTILAAGFYGAPTLKIVITECEPGSQKLFTDRMRKMVGSILEHLNEGADALRLDVSALDFGNISEEELERFRERFWSFLLDPVADNKITCSDILLSMQKEDDIRSSFSASVSQITRLKKVVDLLVVDNDKYIKGVNLTKLTGMGEKEIIGRLIEQWLNQIKIINIKYLELSSVLQCSSVDNKSPVYAFLNKYWFSKYESLLRAFNDYCIDMQSLIFSMKRDELDRHGVDLQHYFRNGLEVKRNKLVDQVDSVFFLVSLFSRCQDSLDHALDKLPLDKFVYFVFKTLTLYGTGRVTGDKSKPVADNQFQRGTDCIDGNLGCKGMDNNFLHNIYSAFLSFYESHGATAPRFVENQGVLVECLLWHENNNVVV